MEIIMADVKQAVANGAAWLDENHPGWVERINLSEFYMDSCGYCVIGQAVGDYYATVYAVSDQESHGEEWAIEHGFQSPDFEDLDGNWDWNKVRIYYKALEHLWTDEILQRR